MGTGTIMGAEGSTAKLPFGGSVSPWAFRESGMTYTIGKAVIVVKFLLSHH